MRRKLTHELMDDPSLPEHEHVVALDALRRINRFSGTARTMLKPILHLAKRLNRRELSLLDVACGGGDVPIGVALLAKQRGIDLRITLIDVSATATGRAAQRARDLGLDVATVTTDARDPMLSEAFDVVTNSLFLHHLSEDDAVTALTQMRQRTRHLLLANDLRRSVLAWWWTWGGCRIVSRSRIVHHDGPVSVEGAFTRNELLDFSRRAGLNAATIHRVWPWRMLLVWNNRQAETG